MGWPIAVAISQTTSHSSLPTRLGMTGRTRPSRRSALVNVPSFSRKLVPGRKTWANRAVSLRKRSWTTTSSIDRRAASTWAVLGSDWAMSSPWTYRPLKDPPSAASNMLGIRSPGSGSIVTPQRSSKMARTSGIDTCR